MDGIHSRRLGQPDGQAAVLAHCFLGYSGSWARMIDRLAEPLDALALDMPGHGRSAMPVDPGDFHALVAAAITAHVTRPSLLIGHSFGAASMLRHALHHPDTAQGMVLIEPVFFAAAEDTDLDAYVRGRQPLQDAFDAGDWPAAVRLFLSQNVGSPDYDTLADHAQALMEAQMKLVAAGEAGLIQDSGGLLAPGMMERFEAPVLLIVGSETTQIFHATVQGLQRRLPRAEIAVVDGAGHMVPISHAAQTAAVIDEWRARTR